MKVEDLNREQLTELKEHYYIEKNENVSYGELANINELVSDNEIFEEYSGVYFVEEDFSCQVDNTRLYNDFEENGKISK